MCGSICKIGIHINVHCMRSWLTYIQKLKTYILRKPCPPEVLEKLTECRGKQKKMQLLYEDFLQSDEDWPHA